MQFHAGHSGCDGVSFAFSCSLRDTPVPSVA